MHIAPLPPAYADLALLQCVFENLLSNALKFSAKCEDPVVEVGVEESAEGETIFFVTYFPQVEVSIWREFTGYSDGRKASSGTPSRPSS